MKLKTKSHTEIIFILMLLLLILGLIMPSVLSLTRTISPSHDNLNSFIVNSYGNYWEPTGDNIQKAIDNLSVSEPYGGGYGGSYGIVWLPSNTTFIINSTLTIEDRVILDMQGSTIVPSGDFDVFELRVGSKLINGIINVSSVGNFNSAVITFRATDYMFLTKHPPKIQNMDLISNGLRGKAIYLNTKSSQNYQTIIAHFDNINTRKFEYAILINHTSANDSAYLNANMFSNIYSYGDKYVITLNEEQAEVSSNYFQNIYCYCTNDTEYIIWNNGQGNVFDNVVAYNWDNNGGTRVSYNFNTSSYGGNDGGDSIFISFRGAGEDLAVRPWIDWQNRYTILDLEKSNLSIGNKNV